MNVREPKSRYLSPAGAKRFYDRLGSGQDWQRFYENPATSQLIAMLVSTPRIPSSNSAVARGHLPQVYCNTVCPLTPATLGSTSAAKWFRLHGSV